MTITTLSRPRERSARRWSRGARVGRPIPRTRGRVAGPGAGVAGRNPRQSAHPAPEDPEPFSAVLRGSRSGPAPGRHPLAAPPLLRLLRHERVEPGILAELLAATLNQVSFLWRTSPAATELEGVVLDWVAELLGLPRGWHGHIEDTASTSTLAAIIVARQATGRQEIVCSEQTHSAVAKAARMLDMRLRQVADRRCLPARRGRARRFERHGSGCGHRRHHGEHLGRSGPGDRRCVRQIPVPGCTSTPRTRARRWSVSNIGGPSPGSSARTRWSSTRTNGCSRPWTARCCGPAPRDSPRGVQPRARVPAYGRNPRTRCR